ncbi:ATP dependent DNA ligase domain-containing protein [Helicostylum pulchrum]|nr:ATP dependent DNA ligase domain-containing protein [Helicostylum pulchrum]
MADSHRSQLFEKFCSSLLDKIVKAKGVTEKKNILDEYLKEWKQNYGPNYYDLSRLLMPIYAHRMYGLKETTLANIIIKALSITPSSPDGEYLRHFKRPQKHRPSGVFHLAVYEVISSRSLVRASSQTVKDINNLLDSLSTRTDSGIDNDETVNSKQVHVFKTMIHLYTPHQIQWIIRIILKDLRIGMSETSILSILHPNAKELYDAGRSLIEVCETIANPLSELSSFNGVRLFTPCIPQCGFKCLSSNIDANIAKLSKPFYAEQKLDGERMLMHYDPEIDKFMWFTRRKNDNTRRYGTSSRDMHKLSGHIAKGLPARSIILDGEMIAYDPSVGGFLPFGTLKSTSKNKEGDFVESVGVNVDINDATKPHPCYVVFDVLFYNGKSLINNTLRERLFLLDITVKNQNNHMKLIPRVELSTQEEIMQKLDEAVKNQEEGLVIKDPSSKYVLNSRLSSWIKFKPEYIDSMVENCDLLVVGAKYGSGKYGGVLRQVLCAVRDDTIPLEDPPKFITFAMVHSGLTDSDVNTLNSLAKTLYPYSPNKLPPWLYHPPNSNEKPDKLIFFEDEIVVEIKGTEINPSVQFGVMHTLRFPRMVKFRPDKRWKDVMTLSEFEKAKQDGRRRQKRSTEDQRDKGKKKQKKSFTLIKSQQGFDTTGVPVKMTLFENMTFYVINGNKEYDKNEIEEFIHVNGGKFIQNKLRDTIAIGSDEDEMPFRLRVFKEKKMWDVIRAQYIVDCVELQDVLPLEPKYMFVTLDKTKKEFLKHMDEFGDSYTKYTDEDSVKELLERMGKDETESYEHCREIAQSIVEEYFSSEVEGAEFINTVAYFDYDPYMDTPMPLTVEWVNWKSIEEETKLGQDQYAFGLGCVSNSISDERITHVVMNKRNLSRFKTLKEDFHRPQLPRFVTLEWIKACMDNRTIVNELDYQPRIPISL